MGGKNLSRRGFSVSLKPARKGRISGAEQMRRNQAAMDLYADLAGKPRIDRFAPEKRAAPTHTGENGKLEGEVSKEIFSVLRSHPAVVWFARINSGQYLIDDRHIKGYIWYSPTVKARSSGIADYIGMLKNGRFFAIEVKREKGGLLSADQAEWLEHVMAAGGIATVARSSDEVIDFLRTT
jgi:hypothetical protein